MTILKLFQYVKDAQSFSAGQTIFHQEDTGDEAYVIIEGQVDVMYGDRLLETLGPGGLVGEMALIDHKTRSATVIAKTDCKIVPITQTRFTFMVQETPHFALEVMGIMADRLRHELGRSHTVSVNTEPEAIPENGVAE